ncbi:mycofactocin biosynthesis peptidyl-dipeptidase MftE [Georgenia sp. SYP-B2076]|uniref:mycofactocin biosynthesis peptidyl-dipeptidase MftE n=1 Tax=Georgenia sp. SYP-B2076 TaxID=2495881 RepID=UPI000F8C5324|nr:mycofactocin biosynthesis peptidyl-dipeptidase MftE [Georgenia sp. SYP-B2076]
MRLADLTWPEVEEGGRGVLVLPVGSIEQHGPHLPLSTDALIAERVSAALAAERPEAGLAPPIVYGASGEHADFPGTMSVGERALHDVVVELVRHVSPVWRAVLVINAHGGNARALARARELCTYEGRHLGIHHVGLPGMDGHAGRSETALMLHLEPDLVRPDRISAGVTQPLRQLLPRLHAEGVRAVSPTGVLGDPRGATAQEGAQLFGELVERALAAHDRASGGTDDAR